MANQKTGLAYFSIDTDIELDDKIRLIEAKYGAIGFAVIIKMFTKIYGDKGYYYNWNDKTQLLFADRVRVDYQKVKEIINDAIDWDIFNKKKFKNYKILTSKRIQIHFFDSTKRRKRVEILGKFIVNGLNDYKFNENVYIINKNADSLKQMKGDEMKGDDTDNQTVYILNFWNSKKIIVHEITEERIESVEKIIKKKKLKKDNIIQAIKNYSTVLVDEKYFFKYIWSLENFLSRKKALPSFLEGGENWENYKQKNKDKEEGQDWDKIKEKRDDYKWKPKSPKTQKEVDKILEGKIIRHNKLKEDK